MSSPNPDLSQLRGDKMTPDKMTPAELRRAFQALTERLDQIEAEITALRDGLSLTATQPQAAPAAGGQTVDFVATILLVGMDDNGQPTYKAKRRTVRQIWRPHLAGGLAQPGN